jgi:hypothetical protein
MTPPGQRVGLEIDPSVANKDAIYVPLFTKCDAGAMVVWIAYDTILCVSTWMPNDCHGYFCFLRECD